MKKEQPAANGDERHASGLSQGAGTVSFMRGGSYEIKVEGHLDKHWSDWLGNLAINYNENGYTLLSGMIPDQAALHGILVKIRDLGLPLLYLSRLENNNARDELIK